MRHKVHTPFHTVSYISKLLVIKLLCKLQSSGFTLMQNMKYEESYDRKLNTINSRNIFLPRKMLYRSVVLMVYPVLHNRSVLMNFSSVSSSASSLWRPLVFPASWKPALSFPNQNHCKWSNPSNYRAIALTCWLKNLGTYCQSPNRAASWAM